MIFSKKRITKVLIRLRGCAGWSSPVLFAKPRRQGFWRRGPFYSLIFRLSMPSMYGHSLVFGNYSRTSRLKLWWLIHMGLQELSSWSLKVILRVIHPGWLEPPLARTRFNGTKPFRAIKVLLCVIHPGWLEQPLAITNFNGIKPFQAIGNQS